MENSKRSLVLGSVITALCLGACITTTDELDLNKEISLDMQIGPGGLFIPVGSLDTLYLDSLIKVDGDDSLLDTLDGGLFGFTMKDSVKVDLDKIQPVTIEIDPPSIDPLETQFENPEVKDVEIPERVNTNTIQIDKIDLSSINSKLPIFSKSVVVGPYDVIGTGTDIPEIPVVVTKQSMNCNFNYIFPDDVKKLNNVWFGETQGSREGQILTLNVDLSGIYGALTDPSIRVSDLEISFPDNFILAKDPELNNYIPGQYVTVDDNVFRINMTSGFITGVGNNHILPVTFYVRSADFSDYIDEIDFADKVEYSLTLYIGGKAGNVTTHFQVSVDLNASLKMADIDAQTRSREIDIDEEEISSSCQVTGLDGISKVNYITFDANKSKMYLSISDVDIDPFQFKGNGSSKIVLRFPTDFTFDSDWVQDENGNTVGSWSGTRLTLDATKVFGHTVSLKVLELAVNETVDEENASIEIFTDVTYSGVIVVSENNDVDLAALDALVDQELEVKFWGKFVVDNANIETGEMRTDFADSTSIDIDQMVDPALVMIQRIDLVEPASAVINLLFEGVPYTVEELTFSRFTVQFPDFVKLAYVGNDKRIRVNGNSLVINGALTDELHSYEGFTVEGLQITGMEFAQPLETVDGRLILSDQKVRINGSVTVNNQKINNNELDVISVTPTVSFEPINVKSVYGKVNPKINGVDEEISLGLGDGTDFLGGDNNKLSLSNPQLTISLTSTITLPIDIDLSLSSKDSKGKYIAQDVRPDNGTIHLPACDTLAPSRTTTLVFYKNERPVSPSDDTIFVRMSRLSDLMSTIPDKILFNLHAGANQDVNHFIDLTRELAVNGEYKVSIPLSFDSLYIEYSDTIAELGKDLEDVADMIDATEIQIMADVESTIPLGVKLTAKAYDRDWNELTDVRIESAEIKAGSDTITKSSLVLGVDVQKGGLKKLESIVFTAAAESGDESSGIRKGQWLLLKKLRIKFPQGIKVDLTDTNKDKDKKEKK